MRTSKTTKNAYLAKLTEKIQMKSVDVGKDLDGSTPPSVFIGRWSYPKVYAGPMMVSQTGDTYIMYSPESWIGENKTQEDIIGYRLNLVRGKQLIDIKDLENPFVEKLQDISLASKSIDSEATFGSRPTGAMFSEESTPHGPSALIEKFDIDAVKWDRQLEKSFYDTDLKARVPTRWSITACDSTIADNLLKEVRHYNIMDSYRVYEFSSLNNYYAIILTPTEWQYEWFEAFIKILGKEEMIFSDYETNTDKTEYSCVGGCYYTAKMAVLDKLAKLKLQSGVIILREAYSGYVPLGVFNVRENIKYAMNGDYKEFESLKESLVYCGTKLKIPISKYVKQSNLLNELLHSQQTTLDSFFKKSPDLQN